MSSEEYRIDFDSSNASEDLPGTLPVDLPPQAASPANTRPTTDLHSNDHLQQLIQFIKDNLTSTFPFALILILKAFYEHSAGQRHFLSLSLSLSLPFLSRHSDGHLLFGQYLSRQFSVSSSSVVESERGERRETREKEDRAVLLVLAATVRCSPSARHSVLVVGSLSLSLSSRRVPQCADLRQSELQSLGSLDSALGSLFHLLSRQVRLFFRPARKNERKCFFRMSVMMVKGLLILYPLSSEKSALCLRSRQRASYLALIEYLSQFYLTLLTIRPWIHFLLDHRDEKPFFSSFLLLFYSIVKVIFLSPFLSFSLLCFLSFSCTIYFNRFELFLLRCAKLVSPFHFPTLRPMNSERIFVPFVNPNTSIPFFSLAK